MKTPTGKHAVVRGVPDTYYKCIRTGKPEDVPDVTLARRQHQEYCRTLEKLKLELLRIDADDAYPDCCFVEDTAIIVASMAIVTRIGAESRVGESAAVKELLQSRKEIVEIEPPGTLDGGDVLRIGNNIYIGKSARTNTDAISQVKRLVKECGFNVVPVRLKDALHLKSVVTYVGDDTVLTLPGHCDEKCFAEYERIRVPKEEAYAANCLSVNGTVIVSDGYPMTKRLIENEGFRTIPLQMSEFRKGDGSLTCLSIIL